MMEKAPWGETASRCKDTLRGHILDCSTPCRYVIDSIGFFTLLPFCQVRCRAAATEALGGVIASSAAAALCDGTEVGPPPLFHSVWPWAARAALEGFARCAETGPRPLSSSAWVTHQHSERTGSFHITRGASDRSSPVTPISACVPCSAQRLGPPARGEPPFFPSLRSRPRFRFRSAPRGSRCRRATVGRGGSSGGGCGGGCGGGGGGLRDREGPARGPYRVLRRDRRSRRGAR